MKIQFLDRQDPKGQSNGRSVSSTTEFAEAVSLCHQSIPFFCELVGENGFNLLVGIADNYGCTQFSSAIGEPPYWMALAQPAAGPECVEFMCGNTPTPVQGRFILTNSQLQKVVSHFIDSGKKSNEVEWEEI